MDPIEDARTVVATRFPEALTALLTGSTTNGMATATSDLDIIVVRADGHGVFRETVRYNHWPVELFVHTLASLDEWYARELADRKSTLAFMVASGTPLFGAELGGSLKQRARALLDAGPTPLSTSEIDYLRYHCTDLIDDLTGARDSDESDLAAGALMSTVGRFYLQGQGRWTGQGKWLARILRETDPAFATTLFAAHREAISTGNTVSLIGIADSVLAIYGGRLTEGYRSGDSD
jgi:hypothetical protein